MKNKTTTTLLAFFLGGLGVHQFYLGKSLKGIFYLLFSWTFIPVFIAFIDFILLLVMGQEKFDLKYNSGNTSTSSLN
ncbi:MAG: NINE protein [Flavobacteriaceae bacterium]|nr:MAG: NINE protein [Flavobacteriaceae bacterium]QMU64131.1 MAG: NINE protein [Flavobacteriaceae bacterium]